ncbi:phage head-tail joining protein [Tritonibacter mobilis]|uniref:phage head-tail joining protein n=1 Tax=Tritonibacter mobilis TaxID=379347 RepID=UPI003A5BA201
MYSQEQLQKLRDAYAKGVLSVELAGEKITFTSGAEMRRRIRDIESDLSGGGSGMTVSYATTGRGY